MPTKENASRTEEQPDGTVDAWYTDDDDVEQHLGTFRDKRTAEFEIGNAIATLEARRTEEPEAAPKAKKEK